MNVKVEALSSVKKKLSFEVPAEKVDTEINKAYQKIARTAKVKGFRPGKVPQAILEQYYAPKMQQEVVTRLINDSYFKALSEHKIPAVSDPEIFESGSLERGTAFVFEAHVEVKPDVEAKDYTGLSLQKEKIILGDQVIAEQLEQMRNSRSQLNVATRDEAQVGDFVTIDFEGFADGEAFAGGSANDYVLELGSDSFIPGFEDQVIGMKRGGTAEIKVTFPEDYGNKELAGKPATFSVTVKEIKEKVIPALDDEFAKEFGFESVDELTANVKENYEKQELNRAESDLRERLIGALIERNPVEVPEAMVSSQLDYMLENLQRRLQGQGMSLQMLGMTDDSFKKMYRETAVRQVQGNVVLEAVALQEELKVEDNEIDGKLEEIAAMAHTSLDAVKKYYANPSARQDLTAQILEEKAIELLLSKATIEEVDKEQLATSAGEADKEA